jgi:hypothetical protein
VQLGPVRGGEAHIGQHVGFGLVHSAASFGTRGRSWSATGRTERGRRRHRPRRRGADEGGDDAAILLGHALEVRSTLGRGSSFAILVPLAQK